ncbi:MAG: sigma-70 family RNA polymerase sigma factor [Hamadaea sp.]|uniref:RNA polymerase sigma factor n=1 Tax=Hamadaea sp. TaxID=2024425 RepID=UPI0017DE769D|nr:sigma-70 family RNA polymerase sigma factor [Hamadaea sp.]NUT21382.1 sigma-70 family RNA polymerase sigma factor [Hamadaea sp.]
MHARRHPLRSVTADDLATVDQVITERHTRLVAAAQAGDVSALEAVVAEHLPMLYGVIGRALNGHCDVDDVVQETLLRVVLGLDGLREPASFRPWLLSIAIRQLSACRQRRRAVEQRQVSDDEEEVADPAAEVQDLTVLRLQLAEQLRQLDQASRWLDPDDRRLLRFWRQEVTGTLGRRALAARVGISVAHAGVRLQRLQQHLALCRAITAALSNQPRCRLLAEAVTGWNGETTSVWRKRIGRHVRGCAECSSCAADLIPADRLLPACADSSDQEHTLVRRSPPTMRRIWPPVVRGPHVARTVH